MQLELSIMHAVCKAESALSMGGLTGNNKLGIIGFYLIILTSIYHNIVVMCGFMWYTTNTQK